MSACQKILNGGYRSRPVIDRRCLTGEPHIVRRTSKTLKSVVRGESPFRTQIRSGFRAFSGTMQSELLCVGSYELKLPEGRRVETLPRCSNVVNPETTRGEPGAGLWDSRPAAD